MAPKECDSLEEVSSAELSEVVAELRQLRVNISKCNMHGTMYSYDKLTSTTLKRLCLENCDEQLKKLQPITEERHVEGFSIVEEPSSYTCEQRGYGKFACACGREWGSTFIREIKLKILLLNLHEHYFK